MWLKFWNNACLLLIACCLLALPAAAQERLPKLKAHSAWSMATLPEAKMGAAYLTIENQSLKEDALLSASTPMAEEVEIHTHEMEQDIIRMRKLEEVPLPASETVQMRPGVMHLMLKGLKQQLKEGERFPITLTFRKAEKIMVEAEVRKAGTPADEARGQ